MVVSHNPHKGFAFYSIHFNYYYIFVCRPNYNSQPQTESMRKRPKYQVAYLPDSESSMSADERKCFETRRIFWPHDGICHSLLQQGPCQSPNDWLVLVTISASNNNSDKVRQFLLFKFCFTYLKRSNFSQWTLVGIIEPVGRGRKWSVRIV